MVCTPSLNVDLNFLAHPVKLFISKTTVTTRKATWFDVNNDIKLFYIV